MRKCYPVSIEEIKKNPGLYLEPFYFLAQEVDKGNLMVSGTSKLLNYIYMISNTTILEKEKNIELINREENIDDPQKYFQGMTIYVENKKTKVSYNNIPLVTEINDRDHTNRCSVTVKGRQKKMIWA